MGYSLDDFFNDHILPGLKELVSDDNPYKFEKFLSIIKGSAEKTRSEDFYGLLIDACTDPLDEKISTHSFIQNIFIKCLYNSELRYLEYKEDGAIVSADFREEEINEEETS